MYNLILDPSFAKSGTERGIAIPEGAYAHEFVEQLKGLGVKVTSVSGQTAAGWRGTAAAATINPRSGQKETVQIGNWLLFGAAY